MAHKDQKRLTFEQLVHSAERFTRAEYAKNFGGIPDKISGMFETPYAQMLLSQAREIIENSHPEILAEHSQLKLLRSIDFGQFESAPELAQGNVAAVDGTPILGMQKYSVGQALCVGVASRSYTRPMAESLHGYTTINTIDHTYDLNNYYAMIEQGLYNINQNAFMRYFEIKHAQGVDEPYVNEPYIFMDGPLAPEWLINQQIGREAVIELLDKKTCIGVIKDLSNNPEFSWLGRALITGEVYIIETLLMHVTNKAKRKARIRGNEELTPQWALDEEFVDLAKYILRGIFKPNKKAFAFECHINHLDTMLRIMAADSQTAMIGHEIPRLLNLIDAEIRAYFKGKAIKRQINLRLSQGGKEDLFYSETDERELR